MRRSGKSFKQVVNESLRMGLRARSELKATKPFRVKARPLGLRAGLGYDNVEQLLELIEDRLDQICSFSQSSNSPGRTGFRL